MVNSANEDQRFQCNCTASGCIDPAWGWCNTGMAWAVGTSSDQSLELDLVYSMKKKF